MHCKVLSCVETEILQRGKGTSTYTRKISSFITNLTCNVPTKTLLGEVPSTYTRKILLVLRYHPLLRQKFY
jgi:hypothetical protein